MTENEILAREWLRALSDVNILHEICARDCRVRHSADNAWMSLDAAIDAVHQRGGLPEFTGSRYTLTASASWCRPRRGWSRRA